MAIIEVFRTDTVDQFRLKINSFSDKQGNLNDLETSAKTSIVGAINSLKIATENSENVFYKVDRNDITVTGSAFLEVDYVLNDLFTYHNGILLDDKYDKKDFIAEDEVFAQFETTTLRKCDTVVFVRSNR